MSKSVYRIVVLTASLFLSGCLTIDSVLNADGSGTMTLEYDVKPGTSVESLKKAVQGPHVTIEGAKVQSGKAQFQLKFDDVTKLSTSMIFSAAKTLTLTSQDGSTTLLVKVALPEVPAAKTKTPKALKTPGAGSSAAAQAAPADATPGKESTGSAATKNEQGTAWRISFTLPGEIVKTNATESKDNRATWVATWEDLKKAKGLTIEATFKTPPKS